MFDSDRDPDINLDYFQQIFEGGNEEDVRLALGHLINWHVYNRRLGRKLEYGYKNDKGEIVRGHRLYSMAMGNPYVRIVSEWIKYRW